MISSPGSEWPSFREARARQKSGTAGTAHPAKSPVTTGLFAFL
jgi:hypothetical protein